MTVTVNNNLCPVCKTNLQPTDTEILGSQIISVLKEIIAKSESSDKIRTRNSPDYKLKNVMF